MAFVQFTRPNNTPVSINTGDVVKLAPVPPGGPLAGPSPVGTRFYFRNGSHQDVLELQDEVNRRLNAP